MIVSYILFGLYIDDSNIFSFIHVSDTHLSKHRNAVRNHLFDVFTKTIIPMHSPEVVVHSGDITDGWIDGMLS